MTPLAPGWTIANLGQLILSMSNGMPGTQNKDGRGVPVSRIETIADQRVDYSRIGFIADYAEEALPRYRLRVGDILFSHINSPAHIGKTAIFSGDETLYHGINLLRIQVEKDICDSRFFNYACKLLRSNGTFSLNAQHAVNQSSLNQAKIAAFEISLPPRAEQQRIADKLDTVLARVDAVNDRLARVAPLLKRFRQSVLAAATSGRLTADWRLTNGVSHLWRDLLLSDIADVQGGVTKDSKKQSTDDEAVPYLRVANVQRGYLDLTELKLIRVPASKVEGLLLQTGDVLFNEGGDLDKLGRGWIWEGQIARCTFQNHVFRARLRDKRDQPKYVSWWGNCRGLDYFVQRGKQTTNLASINKTMLAALPISLPTAEEQIEIVRRVELLFAFADRLEARLQAAQTASARLTPALLAKAFRGELVPQDPNDEPAAELLRRLAESKPAAPSKGRKRQAA